jgi:hypothetical protein
MEGAATREIIGTHECQGERVPQIGLLMAERSHWFCQAFGLKFDHYSSERTSPVALSQLSYFKGGFCENPGRLRIAFQCPYAVPMVLTLTTHPRATGTS